MKRYFCTLFDKNYVYLGLSLYSSLEKYVGEFSLYVLCLDDDTYNLLSKLSLHSVRLVRLSEVENDAVLLAKSNRSLTEYYWTLGSVFTAFVFDHFTEVDALAYVDSDLFFFSDPAPIYTELGARSILIVRHNYHPSLSYLERRSGVYNVGMVIFRRDRIGMKCLREWVSDCLSWCFNRLENGRFGDQMYLNNWPDKYQENLVVLKHLGGGVAPWNVFGYELFSDNGKKFIFFGQELIFYHFHGFRVLVNETFLPHSSFYALGEHVFHFIYIPYINTVRFWIDQVKRVDPSFQCGFEKGESVMVRIKNLFKRIWIFVVYNIWKFQS